MIPREISGPQERFERRGEQALRDIRPLSVRLSLWLRGQASGLVLGGMAGTTVLVPACSTSRLRPAPSTRPGC